MSRRSGRNRPRKTSFRVGNLSWVLTREAALAILLPYEIDPQHTENLRRALCDQDTYHVRRSALALMKLEPWRNQYPQPTLFPPEEMQRAEKILRNPATTEPPPPSSEQHGARPC